MIPDPQKRYLLSDATACRELGISQRTLQRHLLYGKIQAPVGKLAKNRRGWSRAEIELLREQLADVAETSEPEALAV
jgi:predicted site-specific integrase-resolvase